MDAFSEKSEIQASDKYEIYPDERKLRIVSTDLDRVGNYTCESALHNQTGDGGKIFKNTKVQINNLSKY